MPRDDQPLADDNVTLIIKAVSDINKRLDAVEATLNGVDRRLRDLDRNTAYVRVIAKALAERHSAGKNLPIARCEDVPRPMAFDDACSAAPGTESVRVDVPELGLTLYPKPGSDPEAVWDRTLAAINTARGM